MKHKLLPLAFVLLLSGCYFEKSHRTNTDDIRCQSPQPVYAEETEVINGYEPRNYERVKGIWLSYIDLAPMLSCENADDLAAVFGEACRNISELGCNTVYVHVRPFGDAAYTSSLYPPSSYVGGDYDPLEVMCDTAHEYGLSVHAWINPLRLQSADVLSQYDDYATAEWFKSADERVRYVEGDEHLWLDPAFPEVRDLVAEGAAEIAENYDIDGIHYDDYFYPTTEPEFDAQCYSEYGGGKSLSEWRTENITKMCREIYSSVKAVDERIEVSISPQGNIENNKDKLYADVESWCSSDGHCDRIIPQIYFGYENPVKPFISTLKEWQDIRTDEKVRLTIGLAHYKIGNEDEFTDNTGIIASQIEDCKACQGISLYSYGSLFGENKDESRIIYERELIRKALDNY